MGDGNAAKVRYTYRLRVSRAQEQALTTQWDAVRWVWNRCVATHQEAHTHYRDTGEKTPLGPAALDKQLTGWRAQHDWLRQSASVPQQQIVRDFSATRTKHLKDIDNPAVPKIKKHGAPRFKSRKVALPSMNYTRRGFSLKADPTTTTGRDRLHLAGGITVRPVWSRELPAAPTSVRINQDAFGQWWASFVVDAPEQENTTPANDTIGVDWGVTTTATTTDADYDLLHTGHGRQTATRLAAAQKKMARRKPARGKAASKGYRRSKKAAAKIHREIARRRKDEARKWAHRVARDHARIAVEDFNPAFLAKTTMARKSADGAIGTAKTYLNEAAHKHKRTLVLIDPKYTTMDCGNCSARAKHRLPLSQRLYQCYACGHTTGRDTNAAAVMVARAGFDPAGADRVRLDAPYGARAA